MLGAEAAVVLALDQDLASFLLPFLGEQRRHVL